MKPRKLRLAYLVLLMPMAGLASGACSSDAPTNSTGPTQFLGDCASTCSGGLECVCGVCTKSCAASSDCGSITRGATCAKTTDAHPECRGTGPLQVCDLACSSDEVCFGLTAASRCVAGYCRAGAVRSDDAGSGVSASGGGGAAQGGASTGGGGAAQGGASPGSGGRSLGSGGDSASGGGGGLMGAGGAGGAGGKGGTPGSGGVTGAGGTAGTTGSGGANNGGITPSMLPTVTDTCPTLVTGPNTIKTMTATAWVGANKPAGVGGPIVIYWHSSRATAQEAITVLSQSVIQEVQDMGGIVLAPNASTYAGTDTGGGTWYTGDLPIIDQFVACAVQQQHIDSRHIHAVGWELGGGLEVVYMWAARSGYVASVVAYDGASLSTTPLQDPSHAPAVVAAHGARGKDINGVDFANTAMAWEGIVKQAGGLAIDCDDGGDASTLDVRFNIAPQAWQFLKDHPYGVKPEPYTALPSGWPSYCSIK